MARIVRIKNNTAADADWVGQTILVGEYYELSDQEIPTWADDPAVFADIGNSNLLVNDGTNDILEPQKAWNWLLGDTLPMSELGDKLAIHSSSKPAPPGDKEFYLMWTGAGDDVITVPNVINEGPMLQFTLDIGTPVQSIEVHYSPDFGDVYIHEGYAKWEGGGIGDYLEADVVAAATSLQTSVNLDLEIVNNWITLATGGPGTGTHGFAATPTLIKRSKSKDGDWNYDTVNGLTPNTSGTGLYKISDIERAVHHYFNKIPTRGSSYGYTTLTSDESAYMPPGYFIRITANNVSDTKWDACIFMEVYREQTAVP